MFWYSLATIAHIDHQSRFAGSQPAMIPVSIPHSGQFEPGSGPIVKEQGSCGRLVSPSTSRNKHLGPFRTGGNALVHLIRYSLLFAMVLQSERQLTIGTRCSGSPLGLLGISCSRFHWPWLISQMPPQPTTDLGKTPTSVLYFKYFFILKRDSCFLCPIFELSSKQNHAETLHLYCDTPSSVQVG